MRDERNEKISGIYFCLSVIIIIMIAHQKLAKITPIRETQLKFNDKI